MPISDQARYVIKSLCCEHEHRLGSKHGLEEFRSLEFFKNFDWEHIRERPAAIPVNVKSIDDVSNFDDFGESIHKISKAT